ncbi:MAG: HupE/UreJ family protein, partial [bacterium]|nr:HupE/UreJ family protein [bacterium]
VIGWGLIGLAPTSVYAHELLPENVIEYIEDNPNATPDEINTFIEGNAPNLSVNVRDQQDVIRLANQNTSFIDNTFDFLKLGVQHILSGLDHILFVLSFLLVFAGIKTVLKYTTTFTVAHSLTLILAGTGLLTLSSKIVEPIVALSIAVLALSTVFLKDNKYLKDIRYKLCIIFFFGLFHGLGFAGLLQDINVPDDKFVASLFAFNLGIEIGQLIIVAIALPFIYLWRNKPWYPILIKLAALVMSVIAVYWMFERIFE